MELYHEILEKLESHLDYEVTQKTVEMVSYYVLEEIKAVIENDSLDDITCFWRIESIVRILEEIGSNGGSRHDF